MAEHTTLAAALAAFQSELPTVAKGNEANVRSKTGASFKYSYADLSDISEVVLPLLGKQGLAWTTRPTVDGAQFVLVYELLHGPSGESIQGTYPLPSPSIPAQEMGSAVTYARRYALCAVTGIAPGGDGAEAPAADDAAVDPPVGWEARVQQLSSPEDANAFWRAAARAGWLTEEVQAQVSERVAAIRSEAAE